MAPGVVQNSETGLNDSLEPIDHDEGIITEINNDVKTCPIDHLVLTDVGNHQNGVSKKEDEVKIQLTTVDKKQPATVTRPKVLKNIESKEFMYDRLYNSGCPRAPTQCNNKACSGSLMAVPGRGDEPRSLEEILRDAKDFFEQYYANMRRSNSEAHVERWNAVQEEIERTGSYQLTFKEIVFGTKLAWRNSTRCIGRVHWTNLQVFDYRHVTTAREMFDALCIHIKYSTNNGNLRPAITLFPQRTDPKYDFRIWNISLISYAGYREPDGTVLGDPMHCQFTEFCMKLGWRPQRTQWDVLPLVLSANGDDPEFFDIPRELVMEIDMTHPTFEWFKDLKLRWYALPVVSNMRFDCGGIEFPANAFNGWFMNTEVGCRNFCDSHRLNIIEKVAVKMGLDMRNPANLWKDKALVEVNVAVLHSFKKYKATMVDHHTASESFIKYLHSENKLRSGCPADWVWIVPPMSASITPVFHQEMSLYYLRPSYEYQEPPWKTHQWKKPITGTSLINRKFHFKQIARAVRFATKLFSRALCKRVKATILYATETGKSEQYAKKLELVFGHAFNVQVHCMIDYDLKSIQNETLLLVVTSTFGNGDAPENGVGLKEHLSELQSADQVGVETTGVLKSQTIKANGQMESERYINGSPKQLSYLESLKGSATDGKTVNGCGPLSKVRFAVFALGSSAYPNFCNFGKCVDKLLGDLGGQRIHDVATGDEMCGQDQSFREWAPSIFEVACKTFCLDDEETLQKAKRALGMVELSEETVRFAFPDGSPPRLLKALETLINRELTTCVVKANKSLGDASAAGSTISIDVEPMSEINYDPGDHVGIMACNRKELVDRLLSYLKDVENFDEPVQLKLMKETHTSSGIVKSWENHERLPALGVRELFTRFLDITTPPTTILLQYLSKTCSNDEDRKRLNTLATDRAAYEDWRYYYYPTLPEVLSQFPSAKPKTSLLAALLSPMQPRFYSISSSPIAHPKRLHLTVAVVKYQTQDGEGPVHYGVCSNYLMDRKPGDEVYLFIRNAPSFHLPNDLATPLILIGPGTGIAPFRGFWHHRKALLNSSDHPDAGPVLLFFGCRTKAMDLYREEKKQALDEGVLSKVFLALSREKNIPKTYVQDMAETEGIEIYDLLINNGAHFYVCGDCKMAEDVQQKLKGIIKQHGKMSDEQVQKFMSKLKEENRYHEDIFGITLRTAEAHNASHESALRNREAAQP